MIKLYENSTGRQVTGTVSKYLRIQNNDGDNFFKKYCNIIFCGPDDEEIRDGSCFYSNGQGFFTYQIPYGVFAIDEHAFVVKDKNDWPKGFKWANKIIIPNSVEVILFEAFWDCSELVFMEIPASVKKICKGAFTRCVSLKEIEIKGREVEFEDYVIADCCNLKTIKVPADFSLESLNSLMESIGYCECSDFDVMYIDNKTGEAGTINKKEYFYLLNNYRDEKDIKFRRAIAEKIFSNSDDRVDTLINFIPSAKYEIPKELIKTKYHYEYGDYPLPF